MTHSPLGDESPSILPVPPRNASTLLPFCYQIVTTFRAQMLNSEYNRSIDSSPKSSLAVVWFMEEKPQLNLVGQRLQVTITKVHPFGVFVRLADDTEGYIRKRELSLSSDVEPQDLVQPGTEIDAVVIVSAGANNLLELSHKRILPDPWDRIDSDIQIGRSISGTVRTVKPTGVYIQVAPGISGFIPRSQLATWDVGEPDNLFWPGDHVEAEVIRIDRVYRLIILSIQRQLLRRAKAYEIFDYIQHRAIDEDVEEMLPILDVLLELNSIFGQGQSILVVEDKDDLRIGLVEWLQNHGFHVKGVGDLDSALAMLTYQWWLVFIDIDLDGDSAFELVERLNASFPETIVFIVSTPQSLSEHLGVIRHLRIAGVYEKPLDFEAIRQHLQSIVAIGRH